jgi:hypothetical protein
MCRHALPIILATAASLGLGAGQLPAQGPTTEVQLSASVGLSWGGPLWIVAKQPALVSTTGPVLLDTFALARRLAPGLTAWVGFTSFRRPQVGFGAELAWVAAGVNTTCRIVGQLQPDPNQASAVACGNVGQQRVVTSAITALGTVTLRAAPRRDVSPYARVGIGLALLSGSFVGTGADYATAACPVCYREFYAPDSRSFTWAGTLAAGLVFGGGLPLRFRVELRDLVLGLPTVSGPADPASSHPMPPVRIQATHRVTVAMGLELVNGGPRRRRY